MEKLSLLSRLSPKTNPEIWQKLKLYFKFSLNNVDIIKIVYIIKYKNI